MKFKVTIKYDGSQFSGWQKQSNSRSIQEEIEKSLYKITKSKTQIHGSGRTDAGVHALAQVFHFESDLNMTAMNWKRALNATLPKDMIILSVIHIKDEFHARYHALFKSYEYKLNMGVYDPFRRNYEFQYNKELDIKMIRDALPIFIGTHDFTSFNATEVKILEKQIRTVDSFDLKEEGDHLIFTIKGDGFLRYMVRMIIAACVEVGNGKKTIEEIKNILQAKDKEAFARNIDARGLYLVCVDYDEGWEYDEQI